MYAQETASTGPCSARRMLTTMDGSRSVLEFMGNSVVGSTDPLPYYPGQAIPGCYEVGQGDSYDLTLSYEYNGSPVEGLRIDLFEMGYIASDGTFEAVEDLNTYLPGVDLFALKYNWDMIYTFTIVYNWEPAQTYITDTYGSVHLDHLDTSTVYLVRPNRVKLADSRTMITGTPKYIVPQELPYHYSTEFTDFNFWVRETL